MRVFSFDTRRTLAPKNAAPKFAVFVLSGMIFACGALGALAAPYPDGDAVKGAKVYKKCVACHMIGAGAKDRIGPQLNGIIGRGVASIDGYKYSKGMIAYAGSQPTWTKEALDAYLTNPRKTVKRGRMAFAGLRKAKDRHNVIAYLKQASQ